MTYTFTLRDGLRWHEARADRKTTRARIFGIATRMGRPGVPGGGIQIKLRVDSAFVQRIDDWRANKAASSRARVL
jgi:hypothetical protein